MPRILTLILPLIASLAVNQSLAQTSDTIYYPELEKSVPVEAHCIEKDHLRTLKAYAIHCVDEVLTNDETVITCYDTSTMTFIYTALELVPSDISLDGVKSCPKNIIKQSDGALSSGEASGGI